MVLLIVPTTFGLNILNNESHSVKDNTQTKTNHQPQGSGGLVAKTIIGVIIMVIIVALVYVCCIQYTEISKLRRQDVSAERVQADAEALKQKVAKLMELPNETAMTATIQDASKISGQDFFKNAKNGDKVLIFAETKRAVIYRESENKIINSGPIIINSGSASVSEAVSEIFAEPAVLPE